MFFFILDTASVNTYPANPDIFRVVNNKSATNPITRRQEIFESGTEKKLRIQKYADACGRPK